MKVKRAFLLLTVYLVAIAVLPAEAPPFEITPLAGMHFGGVRTFNEGKVDLSTSFEYGIMVSILDPRASVSYDFVFSRGDGTLDFTAYEAGYTDDTFKMSSNYFTFGAAKDFGRDWWRLYIGGDLGAAWFDSRVDYVRDIWFFSLAVRAGAKVYFNDRLGLRLQGRLLMPISFSDSGYWLGIGTGGGSGGLYLGGNVVIFQGDITLGLIIRI